MIFNRLSKYLFLCTILIFISCVFTSAAPLKKLNKPIKWPSKQQIIKVKLYQGDTIMLIWYNTKGDSRCDRAEIIYKSDEYFVVKKLTCKQADETDAYILEPCI